jgi:hypothetical protein
VATADGTERYSALGLCVGSNFGAGVKLCLAENKQLIDAVCAELPGEKRDGDNLSFGLTRRCHQTSLACGDSLPLLRLD